MDIVLKNSLINVKTNFSTLNSSWMREFLNRHARGMLFLQKAVLIFRNDILLEAREEFIKELSRHHATTHDFDHDFFLRSMLRYNNQPIRIELNEDEDVERVDVHLYAYDDSTVLISLDEPNSWVMSYLRGQLEIYLEKGSECSMVLRLDSEESRARLDRTLNKKNVLHYEVHYTFNERFLTKLYNKYAKYSFGTIYESLEDDLAPFYATLECPIGASRDQIRQNYRRLARAYHPDTATGEKPYMITHYTQKFQQLQEAYSILKEVS